MMNFKTILLISMILAITACSDPSDQAVETKEPSPKTKKMNKDHLLKGYQDNLQKAKDMEKEVLRAAEKQKKAIEDATN